MRLDSTLTTALYKLLTYLLTYYSCSRFPVMLLRNKITKKDYYNTSPPVAEAR